MRAQNRFEVGENPDGTPGMRLDATEISYPDLGVYVCSDTLSNDSISLNITGCKLNNYSMLLSCKSLKIIFSQSSHRGSKGDSGGRAESIN